MKTKDKAQSAAPVAPAAGIKRINLAGIATKSPASKTAKAYPVLPDEDGQVAALVEGILDKAEQLEALEGSLEIDKGELIALAKPFYFAHHAGQMAVASSVEARAGDKVVRVGFSNSYRGSADDAPILRVVGEKGATFFKQSFELKIKGDLIPEAAVEEIIGELQEIFARHGAGAALSAKAVFKPNKEFHTARHTLFSAEQNLEIDSRAGEGACETDAAKAAPRRGAGSGDCPRQRSARVSQREDKAGEGWELRGLRSCSVSSSEGATVLDLLRNLILAGLVRAASLGIIP